MTYKELGEIISTLAEGQQNQSIAISCAELMDNEIYPLHRAIILYGDDRLDDGHFVLEM